MRVLLTGGSGLVGSLLVPQLRQRADIALLSLARKPRDAGETAVDFEALAADPADVIAGLAQHPIDIGISCLGTTIAKAGSQAAMRRIDHDYVLATAQAARAQGAGHFILMSSVGAGGGGFYLQVKGEVERSIEALGFQRFDILRPSLLLGPRAERRLAEQLGQIVAPLLNPLLLGSLEKYRAIPADTVAAAIMRLIGTTAPGKHVHEYRDLLSLAASGPGNA
ncbi:NAD-dependent epimerase/dehydratase family protein [Ferrovibrio sp.]|uniref:NAD-dependent epimerase/dehydratase family protein n=1 Tax=Ferrovibrio sp. TaxID=1917215 RepID=UPI0025C21C24|nr:NAD-dependent epimerase/dehydratase family protein [Ferrovibrio sp.]MBX3455906.1 NAD(P)H-binding protein [Ferrovibrio sp.]